MEGIFITFNPVEFLLYEIPYWRSGQTKTFGAVLGDVKTQND